MLTTFMLLHFSKESITVNINFIFWIFYGELKKKIKKNFILLIFNYDEFFDILFRNYFIRDNQLSQAEINTCNMYILVGIGANYHC